MNMQSPRGRAFGVEERVAVEYDGDRPEYHFESIHGAMGSIDCDIGPASLIQEGMLDNDF